MRNILILILFLALPVQAETLTGRVIGITDGDTLKVLDAKRVVHKIRLSGVDAPELNQDFGQRSKANLSALAFNRMVTLECRKTDKYRYKACVVMVDGLDVGLEQIKTGMAWWSRKHTKEQSLHQRVNYEDAEFNARKNHVGLWAAENPVPSWVWRK